MSSGSQYSFSPDCTVPPAGTHVVFSPSVRSSLGILWSCVSIFLLCTCSIQHLCVPVPARPATSMQRFRRKLHLTTRKLKWMAILLLLPEYTMSMATGEFWAAYRSRGDLDVYAREDEIEWSLAHSFLANAGGFGVCFELEGDDADGEESVEDGFAPPSSRISESRRTRSFRAPDNMRLRSKNFSQEYTNRRWSLDLCEQLNDGDRTAMGSNPWRVSKANRAIVEKVIEEANLNQHSFSTRRDCYESLVLLQGNIWILDAAQLLFARQ